MPHLLKTCRTCGLVVMRWHNVRKCRACGGELVARAEPRRPESFPRFARGDNAMRPKATVFLPDQSGNLPGCVQGIRAAALAV